MDLPYFNSPYSLSNSVGFEVIVNTTLTKSQELCLGFCVTLVYSSEQLTHVQMNEWMNEQTNERMNE